MEHTVTLKCLFIWKKLFFLKSRGLCKKGFGGQMRKIPQGYAHWTKREMGEDMINWQKPLPYKPELSLWNLPWKEESWLLRACSHIIMIIKPPKIGEPQKQVLIPAISRSTLFFSCVLMVTSWHVGGLMRVGLWLKLRVREWVAVGRMMQAGWLLQLITCQKPDNVSVWKTEETDESGKFTEHFILT